MVSYGQNNVEIFYKTGDELTIEGDVITVNLTREDTLSLKHGNHFQVQIRILLENGHAFTSQMMKQDLIDKEPYLIIGDTAKHTFTLPFDVTELQSPLKKVVVSYMQNNVEIFHKTGDELTIEGNVITVNLTQEDTFSLKYGNHFQMQICVYLEDGTVHCSQIIKRNLITEVLHRKVIT